jgi:hypothetical protein
MLLIFPERRICGCKAVDAFLYGIATAKTGLAISA